MKTKVALSKILVILVSLLGFPDAARQLSAQETMAPLGSPGVSIAQESHHHLVFQNSFVNVYEVEVPPGYATLMYRHDYDNLLVVFGDANLTDAVEGENPTKVDFSDLRIHFTHAPYAHIIANNSELPFRNITVELLQKQGEFKSFHASINAALADSSADDDGIRQGRVLETDEVQVGAVAVPSGKAWAPPHDGRDRLVVKLDRINNDSEPREGSTSFPAGMLAWFPADADLSVPSESDQQMNLMILEFKDTQDTHRGVD